jgi:(p)ppGpp synthase/HD superfamily hydrolase
MSQIEIARAIAVVAHKGQVDKAGQPYIGHPERVAAIIGGTNEDLTAVAWLHDVIEDTHLTREDLQAAGVNMRVAHAVAVISRRDDVTVEDYYAGVARNLLSAQVKYADIQDNTDPARLALLDDETILRLTRKYAKAKLLLGAPLE